MANETRLEAADARLKTALAQTGLPVSRPPYSGTEAPYLTYQLVLQRQTEHADDDNASHEALWGIDLYARGSYFAVLAAIESLTKAAGFYGFRAGPEIYETDTKLYHIPMEIYYLITED